MHKIMTIIILKKIEVQNAPQEKNEPFLRLSCLYPTFKYVKCNIYIYIKFN